jgi:Zn-dependent protease
MLEAVAYFGFLLNLFNLLPVVPLDGGRAMAAVHPLLWGAGLIGLVGLFVWRPNVILLLILFFGGREAWSRYRNRRSGNLGSASYYRVTARQRWLIGTVYLGLAAVLVLAMHAAQVPRPS